jgi:predicted phage-related endonuclease
MLMESTIKQLEGVNRELKEAQAKIQSDMENETKGMFNHYEAQMKRVVEENDTNTVRLNSEINSLRKELLQLQSVQKPNELDREK